MRSHPKKRQVVQADAAPRGVSSYVDIYIYSEVFVKENVDFHPNKSNPIVHRSLQPGCRLGAGRSNSANTKLSGTKSLPFAFTV